ncbi:MAG: histidinol-phosphate transaminase [Acidimicrobiales bacterium]|nr:histidinol-phosphate transaminase [Acidimicrobiales bacterium]
MAGETGAKPSEVSEAPGETKASSAVNNRPSVRSDVALMAGYHSPQIDVEVRLNTNEAPVAPPAELGQRLAALVRELDWNRYPDRDAGELRAKIAAGYRGQNGGLTASHVFAANGSNEVLQTLLLAYGGPGRTALTFEPTYALHSHLAKITGTAVLQGERRDDFTLDVDQAVALVGEHQPHVVFLCSPNNPTGMIDPPDSVPRMLDAVTDYGGLLVVDEAYGQFAPRSAVELVDDDRPLVVTRTFSKTWSMAALRLGYALAPTWLVDELDKVVLPYHLDALTQASGSLALDYREAMEARVAQLVGERERLSQGLADLPVQVWPSSANFILFRPERAAGVEVWQQLVDRSVLVRNCASWPRLEGCLRVTVGTPEENDRFLAALADIVAP